MASSPADAPALLTACPPTRARLLARDGDQLTLGLPGTDYRTDLILEGLLHASVGDHVTGTLHARARRLDRVTAGGRFLEPVFGRPRRAQGAILGGDLKANTLFIAAGGFTLAATLTDARQSAGDFTLHDMVTFSIERGAVFVPM